MFGSAGRRRFWGWHPGGSDGQAQDGFWGGTRAVWMGASGKPTAGLVGPSKVVLRSFPGEARPRSIAFRLMKHEGEGALQKSIVGNRGEGRNRRHRFNRTGLGLRGIRVEGPTEF